MKELRSVAPFKKQRTSYTCMSNPERQRLNWFPDTLRRWHVFVCAFAFIIAVWPRVPQFADKTRTLKSATQIRAPLGVQWVMRITRHGHKSRLAYWPADSSAPTVPIVEAFAPLHSVERIYNSHPLNLSFAEATASTHQSCSKPPRTS